MVPVTLERYSLLAWFAACKFNLNRDMNIFEDNDIYAVHGFIFIWVGCQPMHVININIVDFQNIRNINLRIILKNLNNVATGNINSDPSPHDVSRPKCHNEVIL